MNESLIGFIGFVAFLILIGTPHLLTYLILRSHKKALNKNVEDKSGLVEIAN